MQTTHGKHNNAQSPTSHPNEEDEEAKKVKNPSLTFLSDTYRKPTKSFLELNQPFVLQVGE